MYTHVNFQVVHRLKSLLELEKLIMQVVEDLNKQAIKEEAENYYFLKDFVARDYDSSVKAFNYSIKYNIEQLPINQNIVGVEFSFDPYIEEYLEDYTGTVNMGFAWGAGEVLNKVNNYIYEFAESLKKDPSILKVVKLLDGNQQSGYEMLAAELYEIEMSIREVISVILFLEVEEYQNLSSLIKNKINLRNKLNREDFEENFENELFALNFSHYKELLKSNEGNVFINDIQEPLSRVQKFRNCIMHNRGFYEIGHQEYEEAKKKLEEIINVFWKRHKIHQEKSLSESVKN